MKAKVIAIMPPSINMGKKAFSTIHIELQEKLENKRKLAVRAFEDFERLKTMAGESIEIDLVGHRDKMGNTHHYTFNSIHAVN